ncbi:cation transporter dimerization domain-containing protein [Bradyrhizobium liaoningense]
MPSSIDRTKVVAWLRSRPGIASIHDVHIWSLSTTRAGLTAHLIMPAGHPGDSFLDKVADELAHDFSIAHVTLQIEIGDKDRCRLAPDDVV